MSFLNDSTLSREVDRPANFKAVNTMMNKPLDENVIGNMNKAVNCVVLKTIDPGWVLDGEEFPDPDASVHMLAIDKDFKYGKGKEIIAFADGGKGTTGKDLKYVKFFYWYDTAKTNVKGGNKTYSYSVEKARTLWGEKITAGYGRFDVLPEVTETTPESN